MSPKANVTDIDSMLREGRFEDVLGLTQSAITTDTPSEVLLYSHAAALTGLGRRVEARRLNAKAAELYPQSSHAWHNLAATLGDLGEPKGALDAAQTAVSLGLQAPETRLIMARSLGQLGQFDQSETMFRRTLSIKPDHIDALRELSQLIWMRTGDVDQAVEPLDVADPQGTSLPIAICRAKLFEFSDLHQRAFDSLAPFIQKDDASHAVLSVASHLALVLGDAQKAYDLATRAHYLAGENLAAIDARFNALMALGEAQKAMRLAIYRRGLAPNDGMSLTALATAARALNDNLYHELMDYQAFVKAYRLPVPKGWSTMDAFLEDLKLALREHHRLQTHPFDQSLRGGTQSHQSLTGTDSTVIKAFFAAVDAPIRQYLLHLGQGDHPMRSLNQYDYQIEGAWSVRLAPQGYHVDHIHPKGWISSAFYVEVPDDCSDETQRAGWLRFGQPRMPTTPPQAAECYVKPEPGMLVLFPSYMWHGTTPFSLGAERMTIAFDLINTPLTAQP